LPAGGFFQDGEILPGDPGDAQGPMSMAGFIDRVAIFMVTPLPL